MDSVVGDQVLPIAFMVSSTASPDHCDDHDSFLSTLYERFSELLNGRFVIITGQNLCFSPEAFPVHFFDFSELHVKGFVSFFEFSAIYF